MLTLARDRAPWIVVLMGVLLIAAALFVVGMDDPASAQAEEAVSELSLYDHIAGFACFAAGSDKSVYGVGGPGGYDITDTTVGVASLKGFGGHGVSVRNVALNSAKDLVIVRLTAPATRDVCASFNIMQANMLG